MNDRRCNTEPLHGSARRNVRAFFFLPSVATQRARGGRMVLVISASACTILREFSINYSRMILSRTRRVRIWRLWLDGNDRLAVPV